MTASCSYVRRKGVSPVNVQIIVLYAYMTIGNYSAICPLPPPKPSLDHLEQGSVCNFNLSVSLGVSKKGVMILDPQLLVEIFECIIVELLSIVRDDDPGDSEAANDTLPN